LPREIDVRSLARAFTTSCMARLGAYATSDDAALDPELRIRAIGMLLDRGWGRPESITKHEGGETPIEFIIRNLNVEKNKK
jgi:hypothetical protein